jgi:hypothetical protein
MSYAYPWGFQVNPAEEARFLEHYGPEDTWVRLFRRAVPPLMTICPDGRRRRRAPIHR